MKIKTKFLLIFMCLAVVYASITFFRYNYFVLPSFDQLDREDVMKSITRLGSVLNYISQNNLTYAKDYASLIEMYEYALNGDDRQVNEVFTNQILSNNNAEFIAVLNKDNQILKVKFNKRSDSYTLKPQADDDFKAALVKYAHQINSKDNASSEGISGYINFHGKLMSIAAVPIVSEAAVDRKYAGSFVFGSCFGDKTLDVIKSLTDINVSLYGVINTGARPDKSSMISTSPKLDVYSIEPVSETEIEVVSFIKDIDNKPFYEIRVKLSRELYVKGLDIADISMKIAILLGLFFVFMLGIVIDIMFIRPLSNFTNNLTMIRENGDYSSKIKMNLKNDEINILKREFSLMLVEIKEHTDDMENIIREKNEKLVNSRKEMIYRLAYAAETKDKETGHHLKRLYQYSKFLTSKCETPEDYAEEIALASILHDIGKIGVSENILLKKERLTDEEFEEMKKHTVYGGKILDNCDYGLIKTAHDIALYHHERFDGKGYPRGLKKKEIPFPARLVSIVDVFDALIAARPYKDGWSINEIKKYFEAEKGRAFDPGLTDLLLADINSFLKIYKEYCD